MKSKPYRWVMTAPNARLSREAWDLVPLGSGEVVVEVSGCGVCHTDLGFLYGGVRTNHELPLTLGHEISGRIVVAGAGADELLDRAVLVPAMFQCGECDPCRRGKGTICSAERMPGNDFHGGFASHIVVPARGLVDCNA